MSSGPPTQPPEPATQPPEPTTQPPEPTTQPPEPPTQPPASGPAWGGPQAAASQPPAAPSWGAPTGSQGGPPPQAGWGTPATTPNSGCLKLGVGAVVVVIVLVALLALAVFAALGGLLGALRGANGSGGDGLGGDCPFLADSEAREVLGGSADATELVGLFEATLGLVLDDRALPDAPDCWITEGDRAFVARVAQYRGGDAASIFAAERQKAEPVSDDQGGGVTVEYTGYFAGDVTGLGDGAFCTGLAPSIMAGVVVHQGDRVVYASVGNREGKQPPDMGTTPDGVITAPAMCSLAQELARAVLD